MRRFVVEQNGFVQLEACRRFIVEVPDDMTEAEAEELVGELQETFPEDEYMAWVDNRERRWIGYDVEIEDTTACDPDAVFGGVGVTVGLKVIRLKKERTGRYAKHFKIVERE